MKRGTYALAAVLLLPLVLSLAACGSKSDAAQIEADIAFLCSKQCGGRLPGTTGNHAAADYIADTFTQCELGVLPGWSSYFQPYTQSVFIPEEQKQTLTAYYPDGTERSFAAGVDYYPYLNLEGGFSGEVTTDPQDKNLNEKILLAETGSVAHGKVTILRSDITSARLFSGSQAPQFRLDPAIYDQLVGCERVTLEGTPITHEETVNNVAGVLKGTDSASALLITAHFDHLGQYGDVMYPGAFDNASGVAVMLETLRQVSSSKDRPDFDIIFIGFNSEEMGQLGSEAFAELDLPYQNVNVVNIDSIGLTGIREVGVAGSDSTLADQLLRSFGDVGLEGARYESELTTDYLTFQSVGIPAVSLSSNMPLEALSAAANIAGDVPDHIDSDFLFQVAAAIRSYTLGAQITEPEPSGEIVAALVDPLLKKACADGAELVLRIKPAFSEEVPFEVEGQAYCVRDVSWAASVSAAQELIPDSYFPPKLGDFLLLYEYLPAGDFFYKTPQANIQVYQTTASEEEFGVPRPVTGDFRFFFYYLTYENEAQEQLLLTVRSREQLHDKQLIPTEGFTAEVLPSGGTLYRPVAEGGETSPISGRVIYDNPALPCVFELMPQGASLDTDALAALMADAIPELSNMIALP